MELWGELQLIYLSIGFVDTSLRHKDYLFQKRLASRLPFDSFRFDFRYGTDTTRFVPGHWIKVLQGKP